MVTISMVATTAGIGGGAMYSAILMFVDNFTAIEAFPISNFIIVFCALATLMIGIRNKYHSPTEEFIDLDMVVVFSPALLLGTKIGVIFNKIFPEIVLNILMMILLVVSSYKTYWKYI
jgi:uncharacterized membrane protein YfcA